MLIERGEFLAALLALLRKAAAGQGRLVFLGGEAGVGKTPLTAALASGAVTALLRFYQGPTCDAQTRS